MEKEKIDECFKNALMKFLEKKLKIRISKSWKELSVEEIFFSNSPLVFQYAFRLNDDAEMFLEILYKELLEA